MPQHLLYNLHRRVVLQPWFPPRLSWALTVLIERAFLAAKTERIFQRFELNSDWFSDGQSIWSFLLGDLKGKPNIAGLEIGTLEGRSALWIMTQIFVDPTSRLTCVDPLYDAGTLERFQRNMERAGVSDRVNLIRKESREAAPDLKRDQFDLIYVDGSHDYEDVLFDASLAMELLKVGGFLIFDDYLWKGPAVPHFPVRRAVDEFLASQKNQIKILYRGYQVVLLRR
jgi:predicted O-methyltransferase YrrM